MRRTQRWFLAILGGLMLTLGGLAWDALIHSQAQGHTIDESLLNLANPGHVVFGAGLVLTVIMTLLGFTTSWLEGQRGRGVWKMLSVPAVLWLMMGLAGMITLAVLSELG